MKIQYYVPGAGIGSAVTLVDSTAGGVIRDWVPDAAVASVQRENLAQSVGQLSPSYRQPLGNISTKVKVECDVIYTTDTLAAAGYLALVIALVGIKNHFIVTIGSTVLYYPFGLVDRVTPKLEGASVTYTFTIESDMVTSVAPA